jgi:hypothetical protein
MGFLTNIESLLRRVFFNERGFSEYNRGKRKLSLFELVSNAEARKGVVPLCPYCMVTENRRVEMMFRHSTLAGGDGAPLREDQTWKCPCCRNTQNFGLPLTSEEFHVLKMNRGGKYLMRPTFRKDERDKEAVKKRLRDLGYLSFEG